MPTLTTQTITTEDFDFACPSWCAEPGPHDVTLTRPAGRYVIHYGAPVEISAPNPDVAVALPRMVTARLTSYTDVFDGTVNRGAPGIEVTGVLDGSPISLATAVRLAQVLAELAVIAS